MKVLITGCKGQLGTELLKQLRAGESELGPIPAGLTGAEVVAVDLRQIFPGWSRRLPLWRTCARTW